MGGNGAARMPVERAGASRGEVSDPLVVPVAVAGRKAAAWQPGSQGGAMPVALPTGDLAARRG